MVALPGLVMTDADVVEEAILLAGRSGQEFADAYVVASAGRAGVEEIATFNRKHFESLGATLHSF
jgi:predicted nucleic acid-binding protein